MRNCKSFYIWTEDRYGVKFFDCLLKRIERELGVEISQHRKVQSTMGDGVMDSKIVKLARAGWIRHDCVIFIRDGDRKQKKIYEKLNKKISDLPKENNKHAVIIVFDKAIESDWLKKGTGGQLPDNYDKAELPDYANKVDINLLREDANFIKFVSAVDP
ncbi:MAG: hypothetical protein MSIBF_05520 [Candidatus Altiarchaeales archaeon IMC4]|nr:MAG: hypothetical protein MSIBF_05520 [Candidatus Altiarchaeales archaeon IMC4]